MPPTTKRVKMTISDAEAVILHAQNNVDEAGIEKMWKLLMEAFDAIQNVDVSGLSFEEVRSS